jgi:hypothetical protein
MTVAERRERAKNNSSELAHVALVKRACKFAWKKGLDEPILQRTCGLPANRTGPRLAADDLAPVFPVGPASCRLAASGQAVHHRKPQARKPN